MGLNDFFLGLKDIEKNLETIKRKYMDNYQSGFGEVARPQSEEKARRFESTGSSRRMANPYLNRKTSNDVSRPGYESLNSEKIAYNMNWSQGERYQKAKPVENYRIPAKNKCKLNNWEVLEALNNKTWTSGFGSPKTTVEHPYEAHYRKRSVTESGKSPRSVKAELDRDNFLPKEKTLTITLENGYEALDSEGLQFGEVIGVNTKGTSAFKDKELKVIPKHSDGKNYSHGYYYEDYSNWDGFGGPKSRGNVKTNKRELLKTADRINQASMYYFGIY